jgi:hypothetical protein
MNTQPDVSILMAHRNGLDYAHDLLWKGLNNAASHQGVTVELCIVDDASRPEAFRALSNYTQALAYEPDFSTITLRFPERQGAAMAYQMAAQMATGRYCLLQSVRTWYEPGALAEMVRTLDGQRHIHFTYGWTQYHGQGERLHRPPPFHVADFQRCYMSLHGVLYRREAHEQGCKYVSYFEREGLKIDICDYDFMMQMIHGLHWRGMALDRLVTHYWYDGEGQMTNYVHRYQADIDAEFQRRWG